MRTRNIMSPKSTFSSNLSASMSVRNKKTSVISSPNKYSARPATNFTTKSPNNHATKRVTSSQKTKNIQVKLYDDKTTRDLEQMQMKIQEMSCQTLISRVEYCMENLEMRHAIQRIQEYAKAERKIEAVLFMVQIHERNIMLESLMQWVKMVYAKELMKHAI